MTSATTICRLLEDRKGIRLKPEYIESWQRSLPRDLASADREAVLDAAFQDFLGKDIADTSRPTIPSNFGEEDLFTFPLGNLKNGGGVVLQLMDALDITNSAHSLLNNLATVAPVRQVYVQRSSDEIHFPRGMLRLTLSDGVRMVRAIELTTISNLDLKTPYGCKILVKNCQVRRGLMLLEASNVQVLGGSVPELYGGNMISELEKRLKLRLGIAPGDAPAQQAPSNNSTSNNINLINNTNNTSTYNNYSNSNLASEVDPPPTETTAMQVDDEYYDDDMDDVDMDQLCAMESIYADQLSRGTNIPADDDMIFDNDESTIAGSPPLETIDLSRDPDDVNDIPSLSLPSPDRLSNFKSSSTSNAATHTTSLSCTYHNDKTNAVRQEHTHSSSRVTSSKSSSFPSKQFKMAPEEPLSSKSSYSKIADVVSVEAELDRETDPPLKSIAQVIDALKGKIKCPDIVRVEAVHKKFTKIKLASSQSEMVVWMADPYDYERRIKVIFREQMAATLLGTTLEDLIKLKNQLEKSEFLKYIISIINSKVNTTCEIELDLSLIENDGIDTDCLVARKYKNCKT